MKQIVIIIIINIIIIGQGSMTGLLISMETIPVYPWHSFFCHASFYHRAKRAKVTISTMLAAGGQNVQTTESFIL